MAEAYGKAFYKCPATHCDRFEQGFLTRRQRDEHLKLHERGFKCVEDRCDYSIIGFPAQAHLDRHIEICHRPSSEQYTFPIRKRFSLTDALKTAIDKDDVLAVREICTETYAHSMEETGFLFRAVQRKSFNVAFVLLQLLGSRELYHEAKDRRTVLHEAVQAIHMNLLREIVSIGVNINAEDSAGRTPLLLALEHKNFDAVRLLWDLTDMQPISFKNWRIEGIWRKGLRGASTAGHHDLVRRLLSTWLKIVLRESRQITQTISQALIKAAMNNHQSTVNVILEIGRETGIEKNYSERLRKALLKGTQGIKMLERPEIDFKGKTKGNALARSAGKGDNEKVIRLLESGADINYSAHLYCNALAAAAKHGNLSMVNLLLDRGADVNAPAGYSGTALQVASSEGHDQIVRVLLANGADVNATTE